MRRTDDDDPYADDDVRKLIGVDVTAIWVSEDRLTIDSADLGHSTYLAVGDCCSRSYFHDLIGVGKLLGNGPISDVYPVDLEPGDPGYHPAECSGGWPSKPTCGLDHEVLAVYGYAFVSEHPVWGEQTSVVSFRNDSNGYYGGGMEFLESDGPEPDQIRIAADWSMDVAREVAFLG